MTAQSNERGANNAEDREHTTMLGVKINTFVMDRGDQVDGCHFV